MQTKTLSAIEAGANTGSGFFISWVLTMLILPVFGFPIRYDQAFGLTMIYTVVSLLRNYAVRRVFTRLRGLI
jgi:hypothetical protein